MSDQDGSSAPFEVERLRVAILNESHISQAQAVFEDSHDYIRLVKGQAPHPDEAGQLFRELPPDKDFNDKYILGFLDADGHMIAIADVVRDYPREGIWFIGLLLVRRSHRNHGLGEEIFRGMERWCQDQGAHSLRLAIVSQNEAGHRFWTRLGFRGMQTQVQVHGRLRSSVIVMGRRLPSRTGGVDRRRRWGREG